jgi:8-oxo-dGTP diphosphatase
MSHSEERPRIGVAVVLFKEGKILLGKRIGGYRPGFWCCPGGHLEFGEDVEVCAARELEEETAIKALFTRRGPWIDNEAAEGKHYISLFVIVTEFMGEPQAMEPHKCVCWDWFGLDALPQPLFPSVAKFLESVRNSEQSLR